jgi:hypothetical protein
MPELHQLTFDGAMLQRGFWLYVWEITLPDSTTCLYVGRTGDSSSPHAQSPFSRLTQHLGTNTKANALRRNLKARGVDANQCRSFELIAFGPILPEVEDPAHHPMARDRIASLEKALCDALHQSGYDVLNRVFCRKPLNQELWNIVGPAFTARFPNLSTHSSPSLADR